MIFCHLQNEMKENQPLDWLRGYLLMDRVQNEPPQKQTNKKISTAHLESEHDNTVNKRGQSSTGQKSKMNTLADSNYFYTEKSMLCTNCLTCVTPFTCTLCARSLWRPDMIADMLINKKSSTNSNKIIYVRQETKHFSCFHQIIWCYCGKKI